jgi:hypothetical protein
VWWRRYDELLPPTAYSFAVRRADEARSRALAAHKQADRARKMARIALYLVDRRRTPRETGPAALTDPRRR